MIVVDLNVLIYAINRDSPHHAKVRAIWDSVLRSGEPIGLAWVVLLGFLRLTTNSKVFPKPLTVEQAISRVDAWLAHPHVRLLPETDDQWRILRDLLRTSGTAGNLTTDAHLASLAIAHGATLLSCDADFVRFATLQWRNALDG